MPRNSGCEKSITGVVLHYLASTPKGDEIHGRAIKQLLDTYRNRAERSEIGSEAGADHPEARYMNELVSLERELIGIQRKALIDLRDRGTISDAVQRRFQVLLDLEESRLEEEERRWNL
jgi:hypothetical protein